MPKGFVISIALLIILLLIWVFVFLLSGSNLCPEKLGEEYYYCTNKNECFLNPKYDCINTDDLPCLLEGDYSARQEIASRLTCDCIDNRCETIVIQ